MIKGKRIDNICSQFGSKRILIYGDIFLDKYIFGRVERISPEAPVPVVHVTHEEFRLGGAGNVAANIDGLGGTAIVMGVVGDDGLAEEILRLKKDNCYLFKDKGVNTISKTRVIGQRQQIVRIDREERIQLAGDTQRAILDKISDMSVDGIIISDYAKGTLNRIIVDGLKKRAADEQLPLVVDPKPSHIDMYRDVTGLTPNLKEAEQTLNQGLETEQKIAKGILKIRRRFRTEFVVVTKGADGMSACQKSKRVFHLPAFSHEVYDVTGAGDTVVAILTMALVSGATLREAVSLSNAAASLVVERVGTAQITAEELQKRLRFILKRA